MSYGSSALFSLSSADSKIQSAEVVDTRRSPRWIVVAVFIAMCMSGFVMFEPAPFDVLLIATVAGAWVAGLPIIASKGSRLAYGGLGLYFIGHCVSSLSVVNPPAAVKDGFVTWYLLVGWLFWVAWIGRYGLEPARWMVRGYLIAAIVTAAIGCLAQFHLMPNSELYINSGTRVQSTFKDPNVFAPFLVGAIVLCLSHVMATGRRLVLSYGVMALFGIAMVFSFSRGALAHLAVSVLVLAVLFVGVIRNRSATRRWAVFGSLAAVTMIPMVLYAVIQLNLWDFFNSRLAYQGYDDLRFAAQAKAWGLFQDMPYGIGTGQWTSDRHGLDTHSTYLNVLVENGVLGLGGLLLFFAGCLLAGYRAVRRRNAGSPLAAAAVAVSVGVLLEGAFVDTLHWRHLFIFLALCGGLDAWGRKSEPFLDQRTKLGAEVAS